MKKDKIKSLKKLYKNAKRKEAKMIKRLDKGKSSVSQRCNIYANIFFDFIEVMEK